MISKQEYEKRMRRFAETGYDGTDEVHRYQCEKCGSIVYTLYAEKGVTPFAMCCPWCGAMMTHNGTYDKDGCPYEPIKWYRPKYEEFCQLSDGEKNHVLQGGLLLDDLNQRQWN